MATSNPAKEVPYLKSQSEGFHSWTREEVEQFENCFSIGTKARLAFSMLMFTGQRRPDIVGLGPQHVKNGWLTFTQQKNKLRKPVKLSIPILPELQDVFDKTSTGHLSFLITEFGKPFTSNGFGNWFRKRCNEAGLPKCSAHGLRKAGATIAAENGATDQQLMAMFGWTTSKQVVHYTRAANQKTSAESGMHHLVKK
ncbi:MAG: tyrosine-type recombinase/integrase [Devosiaceae bacterium]|nr:tyrosine-type recombinase/integrase [Devosiaceae bacterium]